VKKQTLMLVMIGVILFIAGSAIAYASVQGAKKNTNSSVAGAPVNVTAVVAKANIPAGTTGQQMISQNLVSLQPIPSKSFLATDLTSTQALLGEDLTTAVQKGHAISSTQLNVSTAAISIPQNQDAMAVSISGAGDLAGYLQPGAHVDVYADITKPSAGGPPLPANANIPIPCTELAMANIEVLDVSQTSPNLANTKGATPAAPSSGRSVPSSETLLLALTPGQARTLSFLSQNEQISVVQPQQGAVPPAVGECIGTGQTSISPGA
jgi:Flp pilus assembly protein CpaB